MFIWMIIIITTERWKYCEKFSFLELFLIFVWSWLLNHSNKLPEILLKLEVVNLLFYLEFSIVQKRNLVTKCRSPTIKNLNFLVLILYTWKQGFKKHIDSKRARDKILIHGIVKIIDRKKNKNHKKSICYGKLW